MRSRTRSTLVLLWHSIVTFIVRTTTAQDNLPLCPSDGVLVSCPCQITEEMSLPEADDGFRSLFVLRGDIDCDITFTSFEDPAIYINRSNLVFDMSGHRIVGRTTGSGITVANDKRGIIIKNGAIHFFAYGVHATGLGGYDTDNLIAKSLELSDISFEEHAGVSVYVIGEKDSILRSVLVQYCAFQASRIGIQTQEISLVVSNSYFDGTENEAVTVYGYGYTTIQDVPQERIEITKNKFNLSLDLVIGIWATAFGHQTIQSNMLIDNNCFLGVLAAGEIYPMFFLNMYYNALVSIQSNEMRVGDSFEKVCSFDNFQSNLMVQNNLFFNNDGSSCQQLTDDEVGPRDYSQAPSSVPSSSILPSSSALPSSVPSKSVQPSSQPSESIQPSLHPSGSIHPSLLPSDSVSPSSLPSESVQPSSLPSESLQPSLMPSGSSQPTSIPSPGGSVEPSSNPTMSSALPSNVPSGGPSVQPSALPTTPSVSPSSLPSSSVFPSDAPTTVCEKDEEMTCSCKKMKKNKGKNNNNKKDDKKKKNDKTNKKGNKKRQRKGIVF